MGKSIRNLSTVTRVGLDLAKNAFQVHAVDAAGAITLSADRKPTRGRLVLSSPNWSAVRGGDGGVRLGAPLGTAIAASRLMGTVIFNCCPPRM